MLGERWASAMAVAQVRERARGAARRPSSTKGGPEALASTGGASSATRRSSSGAPAGHRVAGRHGGQRLVDERLAEAHALAVDAPRRAP